MSRFSNCFISLIKYSQKQNRYLNSPNLLLNSSWNHVNRQLSTSSIFFQNATASYEEVKSVGETKGVVLIDVREPKELKETGVIPGSINIPLGDVENALKNMSAENFEKKYGIKKPDPDTPIIFSCKMGRRSGLAQELSMKLGFKNVRNFTGGWLEWEKKLSNK